MNFSIADFQLFANGGYLSKEYPDGICFDKVSLIKVLFFDAGQISIFLAANIKNNRLKKKFDSEFVEIRICARFYDLTLSVQSRLDGEAENLILKEKYIVCESMDGKSPNIKFSFFPGSLLMEITPSYPF